MSAVKYLNPEDTQQSIFSEGLNFTRSSTSPRNQLLMQEIISGPQAWSAQARALCMREGSLLQWVPLPQLPTWWDVFQLRTSLSGTAPTEAAETRSWVWEDSSRSLFDSPIVHDSCCGTRISVEEHCGPWCGHSDRAWCSSSAEHATIQSQKVTPGTALVKHQDKQPF